MTTDEQRAALERACDAPGFPGQLTFRATFGGLTAHVGDRSFASISGAGLALRLSSAHGRDLLKAGGKMLQHDADSPASKSAVVVPDAMLGRPDDLRAWAIRSAVYAKSLPPALRKRPAR